MKDYANPALLLAVVILLACQTTADTEATANLVNVWILALCVTGMLVDGALALAKALAHRPSLMSVVWAVAFMILGSCAWAMRLAPVSDEQAAYREQLHAVQDPLARDAEGETLLSRAAALGQVNEVRRILNSVSPTEAQLSEAGMRAAENNKVDVLEELARLGLSAEATVNGVPLLHAAAQNGACEAMEWLLLRGARVNDRDADGSTALIQAATSGSVSAVKLLLRHGADAQLRDNTGHSPLDFARNEEMENLLLPTPSQQ